MGLRIIYGRAGSGKSEYCYKEIAKDIEKNEKIVDNSFLMLLKLLQSIGISYVSCAGFDGYSETENNYFDLEMEYVELKEQAQSLNEHVRHTIAKLRENMQIDFITFSIYNQETNVYSATF